MNTRRASIILTLLPVLFLVATVRAESIDDVKKKIHDKVSALKSLEYKAVVTSEVNTQGFFMKSQSDVDAQYVNKGDKVLGHTEMKVSSEQKIGDQTSKTQHTMTEIRDGQYSYTVSDDGTNKTATKSKIDPANDATPFNAMASFKAMEEHFELKLLPDETVNGKSAWVIEMKPKPGPTAAAMGRSLAYYDKNTGISLKGITFDADGKLMTTSFTQDVKLNSNISPDRFVFKAPPGVEVQDLSKQAPGMP